MALQDQPIIAWRNALEGATYTFTVGTEEAGYPLSNAWTNDTLRVAQVTADASGTVSVDITLANNLVGYGVMPWGVGPYGGYSGDVFVLGAHRHQSAGYRTSGLQWSVGGQVITDIWPNNTSVFQRLTQPITGTSVTLTITGAAANQLITIPELYFGPVIDMPYLDYNFDEYDERAEGAIFKTESGREYLSLRYRQVQQKPSWSTITTDLWSILDSLREDTFENRKAFWFAWAPDSQPHACYLMRHHGSSVAMPRRSAIHRTMRLDLREVL